MQTKTPSMQYLQLAFNRCLLRAQGYTLEKALASPAIAKCLERVAINLQKPTPRHLRGAVND